jgi:phenylalanyl-tRNA synthetase beta chain
LPDIQLVKGIGNVADEAKVIVEDPHLCPRYCARVVKDVKIQSSIPPLDEKKIGSSRVLDLLIISLILPIM